MAPNPTIDRAAAVRQAMRTLVARHGLHGASMSAIAKEAGVAQGPLADLAQVCGTKDPAVAARQGLEQGDAQGGTFLGIGAGA